MKKKLLTLLMALTLSASIIACGGKKTNDNSNQTKKQEDQQKEVEDTSTKENENVKVETSLESLEKYLLEKGLLTGSKTQTAAEMIGAKAGFKYPDSNAEFYEYDTNSDAYKTLVSGGSVEIEGMSGYSISAKAINEQYVLISSENLSQELIDAFNSYGK